MEKFEQYKFECEWVKQGNYLRINYWGDHGIIEAQKLAEVLEECTKKHQSRFGVLNDLRKGETATKEAMDIYVKLLKSPRVKKHAFLVPESGPVVIIPDLLIKMSGVVNAMMFQNEEQAIDYLLMK